MPNLSAADVQAAADALYRAELDCAWIEPISQTYPTADIEDAYRIAAAVTERKLAAGRTIKGHKVGLTSKVMRSLFGATEPDYGAMFDDWFVPEGSTVPVARMNKPLVEVELAFVLSGDLRGPGVTAADVIRATAFVLPCLEIVFTRQLGRGPRMLIDSVADAAACGLVVLGGCAATLTDVDVRRISASLMVNGAVEESGVAAAVMGNPISAVAWLINKLAEFGDGAVAGEVILSGSFVKAIPIDAGDTVTAVFDRLGEVTLRIS